MQLGETSKQTCLKPLPFAVASILQTKCRPLWGNCGPLSEMLSDQRISEARGHNIMLGA